MIFGFCIVAASIVIATVIVCNTIENVADDFARDFFARWDAEDENNR